MAPKKRKGVPLKWTPKRRKIAASNIHSAEELNFLRLVGLLIRIGPLAVRHVFNQQFPASGLSIWLTNKRIDIQNLRRQRIITSAQWQLLYPPGPCTSLVDSQDFDITLMVCLLRNFAGFLINDHNDPSTYTHDTTEHANISRIKFYRNFIVHHKDGEINQHDFNDIWDCVSGAILNLAGNLKKQVDQLAKGPVDADTLQLLRQNEKELELTRRTVLEIDSKLDTLSTEKNNADALRKKTIDEWKKQNENYVSTSATTFVSETLDSSRGVIVTGPPGCGKSAVAHHVALVLESQGYELYPINHPSEVMKVFCKDKKQVLVIDDICGKFIFEQLLSNAWEHVEEKIKKLLGEETFDNFSTDNLNEDPISLLNKETVDNLFTQNPKQDSLSLLASRSKQTKLSGLKIIATCRENIYINTAFPDFNCFNLKQCSFLENYKLSGKELQELALAYLEQTTLDKIQNVALFDFFPLLCSLFQRRKDKDIRFFTHPIEVITAEIKGLKRDSHTAFIALALLVLHNNDLKKDTLGSKEIHEAIKDICKECDIEQALNKIPDCVTFTRLEGIFISESDDGYTAVHDKMFDILSIVIASSIMYTIIKHADSLFIRNRMQLKSHGQSSIGNVIYISEKQKELYMDRQKAEIIKGNFWAVFDNMNTRNEEYRKSLVEFIDKLFLLGVTSNSENTTPLHIVASLGYIELVQYFSQKYDNQVDQTDSEGITPFMKACEKGHSNVVQFLYKYVHRFPNMITKSSQGYSSLHLAANNGHTNVVKELIGFGLNVNDTTHNNLTPLFLACLNGHYNTVEFILNLKEHCRVDTRIKGENGWTALHYACGKGHINIVTLLMDVGMDINKTADYNMTPLYIASYNGQYETVKFLLDMNGDKLDSLVDTRLKDNNGWTALHVACWEGHTNIVKLLIDVDVGMNINETTNNNITPLYIASYNGQNETVKFLLDMNGDKLDNLVDTRLKDNNGWTALHAACWEGHTNIVKLLIDVGMYINETTNNNITPLYIASHNGQYETVKFLLDMNGDKLDSRVDTRIKDKYGWTALHAACGKGHTNIVKLLIDVGMYINETANYNETPLYIASYNGQYETVKFLLVMNGDKLDSRVETRIKNQNGWTALHAACQQGHTNIVKLLIDVGMYINETTNVNYSPLLVASYNGQYETVKFLLDMNGDKLDSRVDTRIKDKYGWTALHAACGKGHTNIVKLLIDVGMYINETANYNETPLYIASYYGQYETVKFLLVMIGDKLDSRVETRIKNQNGWTALHAACEKGHTNIVKLLIDVGMYINETTNVNYSPLLVASYNGQYETVKFLLDMNGDKLDSRVDTRIKDKYGWTALHAACGKGHTNIVKLLIDVGMCINETTNVNYSPLLVASYNGQYETVKFLLDMNEDKLDSRVDTRIKDKYGWTALHAACGKGHTNIVKLLIDVGMYINETANYNETPLYIASYYGQYETVKFLLVMIGDKLDSHVETRIKNQNGWTALHAACEKGHTNIVKLLIDVGMYINETTNVNYSPLLVASYNGQYETVKFLLDMNGDKLDSRVDTRIKDKYGWTALHAACGKGHTNIIKLLIDVGMCINETTNVNYSPLYIASYNGQYETVKFLLDMNGDKLDSRVDTRIKDKYGWTALHAACGKGHTNIVKLLIDVGMYINETANYNETPLYIASYYGQYETVKFLLVMIGDKLDSRVETRIKNQNGWTALHAACEKGHTNIVKLLIDVGMYINETTNVNYSPLLVASYNGQYETVKFLLDMNGDKLDSRVDTRIKDKYGWTALHAACGKGHTNIVKLLIDVGMYINETTNDNETPLYIASCYGQYETVKFLLDMNGDKLDSCVDTRIKAKNGLTALHAACHQRHTNIVKLLIDVGMNINETTNYNHTPLCIASYYGQYETVKFLLNMNGDKLDSRVDTRIKNQNGWTALHAACEKGHTNIVELLIIVGMNINETTHDNETPLFIASGTGRYETVKFLLNMNKDKLDSRVDTRMKTSSGRTALHAACEKGHTNIVELLIDVGMNINETTNVNYSPLYLASAHGQYETVKFLLDMNGDKLDSRVDTRIKDQNEWTALHAACEKGHTNIVKLFIDVGMNINETTNYNQTPLCIASYNGQYETVKFLLVMNGDKLDSRVDTRIKDKNERTALHLACWKGNHKIVQLFLENYAKTGHVIKPEERHKCIGMAQWQNHEHIVNLLRNLK